jgi:hypothetical protein
VQDGSNVHLWLLLTSSVGVTSTTKQRVALPAVVCHVKLHTPLCGWAQLAFSISDELIQIIGCQRCAMRKSWCRASCRQRAVSELRVVCVTMRAE